MKKLRLKINWICKNIFMLKYVPWVLCFSSLASLRWGGFNHRITQPVFHSLESCQVWKKYCSSRSPMADGFSSLEIRKNTNFEGRNWGWLSWLSWSNFSMGEFIFRKQSPIHWALLILKASLAKLGLKAIKKKLSQFERWYFN